MRVEGAVDLAQIASPASPDSGRNLLYVKSDGLVYKKNSTGTEELVEGVKLSGNQTVGGIKDFSSSPTAPDPTTSTQLSTKAYVDSMVSGMSPVGQQLGLAIKTVTAPITNTTLWSTLVAARIGSLSVSVTGTGRPVDVIFKCPYFSNSTGTNVNISIWFIRTTPAGGGTITAFDLAVIPAVGLTGPYIHFASSDQSLTYGATYKYEVGVSTGAGNTVTLQAGTTPTWTVHWPMSLEVIQR